MTLQLQRAELIRSTHLVAGQWRAGSGCLDVTDPASQIGPMIHARAVDRIEQSPQRIWRVAEALEAGIVGINEGTLAAEAAPFGGGRHSGHGREGSVHGLDDHQHIKYLCQGSLA